MTKINFTKKNISLGLTYSFRSLAHYNHGGNVVLEKLGLLHLDSKAEEADYITLGTI